MYCVKPFHFWLGLSFCVALFMLIRIWQAAPTPPSSEELGRSSWTLLHVTANQYPEEPSDKEKETMRSFIASFAELYPCEKCKYHLKRLIRTKAPPIGSGSELRRWFCEIHNEVNSRLGKSAFSCESQELVNRWGTTDSCAGSCSLH